MPTNESILEALDDELLKKIEQLAAGNMAPSSIALRVELNKAAFMRLWRQPDSRIREAYERGRLHIHELKAEALKEEITEGNITAIQIHDKHTEEASFADLKAEIFGFNE